MSDDVTLKILIHESSICDILEFYEEYNEYTYTKYYPNDGLVMFATNGWSDNEHFIDLLLEDTNHKAEYVGYTVGGRFYFTTPANKHNKYRITLS